MHNISTLLTPTGPQGNSLLFTTVITQHQSKLDAIAMIGGSSLEYFSNVRWGNSERLFIMVLPARGEAFFIAPAFDV